MHYSGALYPVSYLYDYVSLLLMKVLIPTIHASFRGILNSIYISEFYVFCFVDDSLSNGIAMACIKTFLSLDGICLLTQRFGFVLENQ